MVAPRWRLTLWSGAPSDHNLAWIDSIFGARYVTIMLEDNRSPLLIEHRPPEFITWTESGDIVDCSFKNEEATTVA